MKIEIEPFRIFGIHCEIQMDFEPHYFTKGDRELQVDFEKINYMKGKFILPTGKAIIANDVSEDSTAEDWDEALNVAFWGRFYDRVYSDAKDMALDAYEDDGGPC